jgi:hypothetical protein
MLSAPPQDRTGRWLERSAILVLFLIGLFLWGDSLAWGNIPWDQADWYDISGPRLFYLQEAVRTWQLPLHVDVLDGMKGATDRYISIPDVILSPQVILLRWLSPGNFVLVQSLALYALGFWGLSRIKRRWGLSLGVFTLLFLIYNFNGHLVAHMAVGHATWWSVFLLPWFVLWVMELLEDGGGWRWAARVSMLLAFIYLQGGFHHYLWCWLFLVALLLFRWRLRKPLLLALAFSMLLSMARILPTALVSADLNIGFLSGFTSTGELLSGLVTLRGPARALETITPLNPLVAWWEFDHYIGWAGVALLALGGYRWLKERNGWGKPYLPLLGACGVMAVLSVGRLYRVVFLLEFPFLTGERVTSRFLLLPLLFIATLAALALQRGLDDKRWPPGLRLAGWGGLLLLFNDLMQHRELWKLDQLEQLFPHETSIPLHVANHADPLYTAALIVGGLITLAALVILFNTARRSNNG